ncbi:hypothetical protein [Leuconostoc sp. UCMA20149]|uniref:hypothetical protein n=1 Tax=Leuconostoc sp. UCMA20149 TaxID=2583528 RepID=UPI0025B0CF16|nr:hypothetical protein [Leuconostoc sp. UCMA20149]MDN2451555.1 hypothetical protein [Leuconostoc sp. UCMA20149]
MASNCPSFFNGNGASHHFNDVLVNQWATKIQLNNVINDAIRRCDLLSAFPIKAIQIIEERYFFYQKSSVSMHLASFSYDAIDNKVLLK